jgi:DNA-binding CsgD family transcriptional regulator
MPATVARHRDALVESTRRAGDVRELFAAASTRLRRAVPYDAAVWLAVDPATSLPTAPTRSENMDWVGGSEGCLRLWELEFLADDVDRYRDVARAETPARALREATAGRPERSTRFREFLRPNGLGDELRGVLRADDGAWACLSLFREEGRPPFGADEVELVAALSRPLAEMVRAHARTPSHHLLAPEDRGPGLMLFAPTGELVSANDDARAWLDELPPDAGVEAAFEVGVPMVVAAALVRARAIARGRGGGSARARMRSAASGRWLVCHASALRDPDGRLGHTALTIEPAKAAEIAPIIVRAYELSPREQQVTQLVAQGCDTAQIAGRLFLSRHTVRDYLKAIFEKVGVSSRGELVARLFAEHYAPLHTDPSSHDRAG